STNSQCRSVSQEKLNQRPRRALKTAKAVFCTYITSTAASGDNCLREASHTCRGCFPYHTIIDLLLWLVSQLPFVPKADAREAGDSRRSHDEWLSVPLPQ
ncbi:hypothetical protein BaRGS_00006228, partial [Batillaria attramentaria]